MNTEHQAEHQANHLAGLFLLADAYDRDHATDLYELTWTRIRANSERIAALHGFDHYRRIADAARLLYASLKRS